MIGDGRNVDDVYEWTVLIGKDGTAAASCPRRFKPLGRVEEQRDGSWWAYDPTGKIVNSLPRQPRKMAVRMLIWNAGLGDLDFQIEAD